MTEDNALLEGWPLCEGWLVDMNCNGWPAGSAVCVGCCMNEDGIIKDRLNTSGGVFVSRKCWELIVSIFGYRLKSHTDSDGNHHRGEVLQDPDGIEPVMVSKFSYYDAELIVRLEIIDSIRKQRSELGGN